MKIERLNPIRPGAGSLAVADSELLRYSALSLSVRPVLANSRAPNRHLDEFLKLWSNLGPFAAENQRTRGETTQSQPKRDNKLANRFLVRDQGSEVQIDTD